MDEERALVAPAVVRITDDERLADEWALVLSAAAIENELARPDDSERAFRLLVDGDRAEAAARALDEYDAERAAEAAEPVEPEHRRTLAGYAAALGILAFFWITLHRASWYDAGEAVSSLMRHEPWRAVTALTLHADWMHALGNAVAGAIFFTALFRWVGPGTGAWLTLASGALGNWATAAAHGPGHFSLGASTATFGALGALAGLRLVRRRIGPLGRRRALVAVAAAMGLFGMLGVGPNADVFAHLFGLAAGIALGAATGLFVKHRWRAIVQWPSLALAVFAIAGCWRLALYR